MSISQVELRRLRKKQIIVTSVLMISISVIFTVGLIKFHWPLVSFFLVPLILHLLNLVIKDGFDMHRLFPDLKPLLVYEKQKLGEEYEKLKLQNRTSSWIVVFIFTWMVLVEFIRPNPAYFSLTKLKVIVPAFSVVIIWSIVYNLIYYRKIDESNPDQLKDFSKWVMNSGIVSGVILMVLLIGIIITMVISELYQG